MNGLHLIARAHIDKYAPVKHSPRGRFTLALTAMHVLNLAYNYRSMDRNSPSNNTWFGIMTVVFVLLGLVFIFYLYKYLYSSSNNKSTILVSGKQAADSSPANLPTIPAPYEGGEYSVNTWVYISSFNKNMNKRKHIFELQGNIFSTLLIGLGAFNNTLIVRTHTKLTEGFLNWNSNRNGSSGSTAPANAQDTIGNLSAASLNTMFANLAMNDSLLDTSPICDLPEIDLQRWTMITVVLTGRTIDVYLDGKLSRSCVAPSYYKVDPTGVKPIMTSRGGFDGYTGTTSVANYAMNPDEIYRTYLSGPEPSPMDILNWFLSLFKGSS